VFLVDLPPDLLFFPLEMGRAGRRSTASADTDFYYVCYSLTDYADLLQRIYKVDKSQDFAKSDKILPRSEYQATLASSNLQEVLAFFVLPKECLHVALARKLGNPFQALALFQNPNH
jgi:hypothetical protein